MTDESAIKWDLARGESYGGYLSLDTLLAAQHPRSDVHDEMLFIIVHQTAELWLKLILHELAAVQACLRADDVEPALKHFARISRAQSQMIQSWDVLATMTPADYSRLRPSLGPSSGFQSHQYRVLEFVLGNKVERMARVHRNDPPAHAALTSALAAPSLYDDALHVLSRRGLHIPDGILSRPAPQPHVAHPAVEAAWLAVYRDPTRYWDLYDLAEKLVDLEDRFRQWRHRHVTTVERIIGHKTGTGGSSGVSYLRRALDVVLFPELWSVRTSL